MIFGYVEQPSPRGRAGRPACLHRRAAVPRGAAPVGDGLTHQDSTPWFPGARVPLHLPLQDWGEENKGLRGETLPPWPAYEIPVPEHWRSGV